MCEVGWPPLLELAPPVWLAHSTFLFYAQLSITHCAGGSGDGKVNWLTTALSAKAECLCAVSDTVMLTHASILVTHNVEGVAR